jgi:hypothetical protein
MTVTVNMFLSSIISTALLDGLVLGLGGSFILSSVCGVYITRRRPSNVTWAFGGILALITSTISGLIVYFFIGLVTFWAGPAVHGLSGTDLNLWNSLVSTLFSINQYLAIMSSYMGAIAGLGMGYGIGVRPREEATTFGVVWAVLAVFILLTGLAFIFLQTVLAGNIDVLYFLAGLSTVALVMLALYQRWRALPEPVDEYVSQYVSDS